MKTIYFTIFLSALFFVANAWAPHSALTASANSVNATCSDSCGGSASVSPSGGVGPYRYLWTPGNDTTDTIIHLCVGTYMVRVTDNSGDTINDTVSILIPPAPVPTVSPADTSFCAGGNVQLCVVQSFAQYLWNGGDDKNCILADTAGTYSVQVTDTNGCTGTANATVNLDTVSVVVLTDKTSMCPGDSAFLCAPSGFISYEWNTKDTGACFYTQNSGNYSLTVIDQNGCSFASNQVSITINPLPEPTISPADTSFCSGGSVQLCVVQTFSQYLWNGGDNKNCIMADSAGTYTVQVTDTNGCTGTASASVSNTSIDSVIILSDKTSMCPGDSAFFCAPSGFVSYLWDNKDTSACFYTQISGNYFVVVEDSNGCTATSNSISLDVCQNSPVLITGDDTLGGTICAAAYIDKCSAISWYLNDSLINDSSSCIVVNSTGIYTYIIIDVCCKKKELCCSCPQIAIPFSITGITDLSAEKISVYPNPLAPGSGTSREEVTVGTALIGAALEIFDSEGKIVYKSKINKLKSEIELNVAPGIYLLHIQSPQYTLVRKLVKL